MLPGQFIYTPQQLMAIDDQQGIFYLGRDIELNNWEKELILNGTLYGDGHTIRYSASNKCYGLFKKISKEKQKVDFVIFLTPQIIENTEEMRATTMRASGFSKMLPLSSDKELGMAAMKAQVKVRKDLASADVGSIEADIDNRFRELYQKSLKRK
mgnify:CR=1 FL=1